jgi:hypothetical protein
MILAEASDQLFDAGHTLVMASGRAGEMRWMYRLGRRYNASRSPVVTWLLTKTWRSSGRWFNPVHSTSTPRRRSITGPICKKPSQYRVFTCLRTTQVAIAKDSAPTTANIAMQGMYTHAHTHTHTHTHQSTTHVGFQSSCQRRVPRMRQLT